MKKSSTITIQELRKQFLINKDKTSFRFQMNIGVAVSHNAIRLMTATTVHLATASGHLMVVQMAKNVHIKWTEVKSCQSMTYLKKGKCAMMISNFATK